MMARLAGAPQRPSFVRSFAYETGPAYGLLLDGEGVTWRGDLAKVDLVTQMEQALDFVAPEDLAAEVKQRGAAYEGDRLRAGEEERARSRDALRESYRKKLVDGPVLTLPMGADVQYSFDPNGLIPLEALGTVYPEMKVTDAWGTLDASGGVLMSSDRKRIVVAAPKDVKQLDAKENGWALALAPGWSLQPGARAGDFVARSGERK
jgi:hypothetical protein